MKVAVLAAFAALTIGSAASAQSPQFENGVLVRDGTAGAAIVCQPFRNTVCQ